MMDEVKSERPQAIYDEYNPQDNDVPTLSPIVIAHAILDTKKNWKPVAAALAEKTKRKVYVLDIPDNDDGDPPMDISLESIYKRLEKFLMDLGQPVVLIGHSMGAVISIVLATKRAYLVNRLVIIDISPVDYPSNTAENLVQCVKIMREAIAAVPKGLNFQKTQSVIMKYFEKAIPSEVIRKMLLGNLIEGKNRIKWRCDLDYLEEEFKKDSVARIYPLRCLCYTECLLAYGELSDFVFENDFGDMKVVLPKIKLHCMKGSSHWIHLEQPEKLADVISDFINLERRNEEV